MMNSQGLEIHMKTHHREIHKVMLSFALFIVESNMPGTYFLTVLLSCDFRNIYDFI